MDNYISQQMQNWKKMMIMDPLLNNLFDHSLNIKDFIHDKILTLQHQQIVQTYSRLSSVKHAISKNIQKEVETKHDLIEKSFLSKHKITNQLRLQNESQILESIKHIQNFNQNYSNVKQNIAKLHNINRIIQFSKGLERFKINCRLLKTFMKDHTSVRETTNKQEQMLNNNIKSKPSILTAGNQSLNLSKISKILKQLNDLTTKNDFNGIKYYEAEKQFINSSKATVYFLTERQLNRTLLKYQQAIDDEIKNFKGTNQGQEEKFKIIQEDIKQKIRILYTLNKIKQFLTTFVKKILKDTADVLKNLFQAISIQNFRKFLISTVYAFILSNAKMLLRIQEILSVSMISKSLSNSGIPNLFQKFIQRLISYILDLVKWNQDQDNKQTQKRKNNLKDNYSIQMQIIDVAQNKNSKTKVPLIYKYPSLLNALCFLTNKIHQQVLMKAQYNLQQYSFYSKKQQIINSILPLSIKFHQFFSQIIKFSETNDQFIKNQKQNKIKCLRWFYSEVIGVKNLNQKNKIQINQQNNINQLSTLIEALNQKVILKIEYLMGEQGNQNNPIPLHLKNQERQVKNQDNNKDTEQITKINQRRQIVKGVLQIIQNKQVLKLYVHIQIALSHLKRLKTINEQLQMNHLKVRPSLSAQNYTSKDKKELNV